MVAVTVDDRLLAVGQLDPVGQLELGLEDLALGGAVDAEWLGRDAHDLGQLLRRPDDGHVRRFDADRLEREARRRGAGAEVRANGHRRLGLGLGLPRPAPTPSRARCR